MGNFQGGGNRGGGGGYRGGNGGGRPSYGGNRGGGDRGPVTMHKAVCDECHKSCEVPFRPSGDKPIYCNDCFASKREDSPRPPRKDFGDRGPKRDFGGKPNFQKSNNGERNDELKKQLVEMNMKLDRLIVAIEALTLPKESPKKVIISKPVEKIAPKKVAVKASVKKVVKKKAK